jgi:hypothetical protein
VVVAAVSMRERREAERVKACERKRLYATAEEAAEVRLQHADYETISVYLCPYVMPHGRHYHLGHAPYWWSMSSVERLLNKRLKPKNRS